MEYTYDSALAERTNRTTLDRLIDLVRNTSAKVEGAASNATSLLYAGDIDGKPSFELAKSLVNNTQNEAGAGRLDVQDVQGHGCTGSGPPSCKISSLMVKSCIRTGRP